MPQKLTASGIGRVHELAEQLVARQDVPGLVVLVASGDEVHVEVRSTDCCRS
jgi:hypothetical protein